MPSTRRTLVLVVQVAFAAAVLWYAGVELVRQWGASGEQLRSLDLRWSYIAASCLLVLLGYAVLIQTWRLMLRVLHADLPALVAARIWFVSNLGRYVPGKVWQISAMGVMTHRHGVSPVAATSAALMVNLVNIIAGCLVVFLTGAGILDTAVPSGRLVAIILLILAFVSLFFIPAIVSWLARRRPAISGKPMEISGTMSPRAVLLGLGGTGAAWVLYGLAFQLFTRGVLGEAARGASADYIAVYTASYLVGYLTLIAPGGLGVREAMLVIALRAAGIASGPGALLLAVASRLWLTVLEILPGVLFLLAGARLRLKEDDASSAP